MITFNFEVPVKTFRNRLNVYRHATKDKSLPILSWVRVRYVAGEKHLTMLATDKYTIAEVALPLTNPVDTDFEGFVRAEDIARVHKQTKVSTRTLSLTVDGDRGTFTVDGVEMPVAIAQNGDPDFGTYPNVDRLWPSELTDTGSITETGINSAYLDRFRHLNEKTSGALRLSFDGIKPVVVLPISFTGWRGMIVGIRMSGGNDYVYRNWKDHG